MCPAPQHARVPAAVPRLFAVVVGVMAAGTGGCRFLPRSGAVPQEVAAARRLCNEGLSAADRKDLLRAEGLLERAVKQCPTDVDARRHYADVLWARGERMAAVAQVAEALRLSPGDTGLCIDGGRMYMELGLLDDADRLSREAVRLAPRSEKAWRLHGQVALARGRPEEALADLHRALSAAPEDRDLLLETAEVYRRAVARGLDSPEVVARLERLDREAEAGRPAAAVADAPSGGVRQ